LRFQGFQSTHQESSSTMTADVDPDLLALVRDAERQAIAQRKSRKAQAMSRADREAYLRRKGRLAPDVDKRITAVDRRHDHPHLERSRDRAAEPRYRPALRQWM
jgi:hypothetical protein